MARHGGYCNTSRVSVHCGFVDAIAGVSVLPSTDPRIAIVGAGFSGLGMAIRLRQAGIEDFVVLEREREVGGTWWVNTYPGCQCDVPSHLYSFSFARNPNWSRTYSHQPEIQDYLRDCSRRYQVASKIAFGCEVTAAAWNSEDDSWELETSEGSLRAKILIAGAGALTVPAIPEIDGRQDFAGRSCHSARWNHGLDLTGKRVAVIGTGASAIQLVPKIQPRARALHLFQRTPPWVFPRTDRSITEAERRLYRRVPLAQKLVRAAVYANFESRAVAMTVDTRLLKGYQAIARWHLRRQVRDPRLRARLTPSYLIGCKRILLSNDYYPALTRPNVELVTDRIEKITRRGIVTIDGCERELDAIVFATGFQVADWPTLHFVRGRDGATLADAWRERGAQAFLGTTVSGFPNFFMLLGPNTGLGHNSVVYMIESQIGYVVDCLRMMNASRISTIEVRPEAQAAYDADLQSRLANTVWASGCASWYLHPSGRNPALWPSFTFRYRRQLRRFDPRPYTLRACSPSDAALVSDRGGLDVVV